MSTIVNAPNALSIPQSIEDNPGDFRMLTGDRPTGLLHVGHYFGTLQGRVRLQNLGVDTLVLIADYQVLTDRDAADRLPHYVEEFLLDYLAVGIDPSRSTIFAHSAVPALNQLLLPFLSLVSTAELSRNPTVKEEIAASGRDAVSGLMFTYPVHQAADLLFCNADIAPVGDDQIPHLELTRTIARRFNDRYEPLFTLPQALLSRAPRLRGLDGSAKMGKSLSNAIPLSASADETARMIRTATTDADRHITYDPEGRPEVSNLLLIASLCTGHDPHELADGLDGAAALKRLLTEAVNEHFAPIRLRRQEYARDRAQLRAILRDGNARASAIADDTLARVHRAMRTAY
ncbi:tryptophan--tRNA ligase [Stackebrandtia soli]|uniref:tryptophan--tRNA ligase n=1 Tax=Stackebrandtia soli TaxID=1892856 RepID=UPI0039EC8174